MTVSDTVALVDVLAENHKPEHHSAGDGVNSPRESWVTCSCGIHIWDWQQFYNENQDDHEVQFALHLAYFAARNAAKQALLDAADDMEEVPGGREQHVPWLRARAAQTGATDAHQ